ncbi:MAG: AsmA family protein [Alphaproteobacteria bacterium]
MKKGLLFLIILLGLLAAAVVFLPSFVDWNKYKPQIAHQINQVIGREVLIDGDVSFQILPYPFLSLGQTRVRNISGSEQETMANIKNIEITVEPYSLLKGEIRMKRISLINPEIMLEVLADGQVNWNFLFMQREKENNFDDSFGKIIVKDSIILDSITVQNGTIIYSDKKRKIEESLNGITADIVANSLKGPYRADGNFNVRDRQAGFALSIGEIGTDSPTDVNFTVSELTAEAVLNLSGEVSNSPNDNLFSGNVSFNVQKIPVLLPILDLKNIFFPKSLDMPFAVNSSFSYNPGKFTVEDLVLKYGETAAAGKAVVALEDGQLPVTDANLYFTQLSLDPIVDALKEMREVNLAISRHMFLSKNINAQVSLGASSISYKDGSFRNFEAKTLIKDGILTIGEGKTNLVGNSMVGFAGIITPEDGLLKYNFDVDFQSENTKQLLKWLGYEKNITSDSIFRNSLFKGNISGSPTELNISEFEAALDRTKARGTIGAAFADKNAFDIQVTLDEINLDSYMTSKTEPSKNIEEALKNNFNNLSILSSFDAKGSIVVSSLIYNDVPVKGVSFEGELSSNNLTIDNLDIQNLAGLRALFKGGTGGFGEEPRFNKFYYNIEGEGLPPLIARLGWTMPFVKSDDLGLISLDGTLNGDLNKLEFDSSFGARGGVIKNKGYVEKKVDEPRFFDMELEASHLSFNKFLDIFGKGYTAEDGSLGVFKFYSKMAGNLDKFNLSDMELGIGLNKIKGNLTVTLSGDRPKFEGNVDSVFLQLNKLFPKDSFTVFSKKANGTNVAGRKIYSNPNFILSSAVFVPELSSNLLVKVQNEPKFSTGIKAKPQVSVVKFKTALLSMFDTDLVCKIDKLEMFGYSLEKAEGKLKIEDRVLDLSDFKTIYRSGTIAGALKVDVKEIPKVSGNIDVVTMEGKKDFFGTNIMDVNGGIVSFKSSFDTVGESQKEFFQNFNANGEISFSNASVSGFDLGAINAQTAGKRNDKNIEDLIMRYTEEGETPFDEITAKFSVDKGILEAKDITMRGGQGSVNINFNLNLNEWVVASKASFQTVSNSEVPPFEIKLIGNAERPDFKLETTIFREYFKKLEEYDIAQEKSRLAEIEKNRLTELEAKLRAVIVEFDKDQKVKKDTLRRHNAILNASYEKVKESLKKAEAVKSEIDDAFAKAKDDLANQKDLISDEIYKRAENLFKEKSHKVMLSEVDTERLDSESNKLSQVITSADNMQNQFNAIYEKPEILEEDLTKAEALAMKSKDLIIVSDEVLRNLSEEKINLVKTVDGIEKDFIKYIKVASVQDFVKSLSEIKDSFPSILEEAQSAITSANDEFATLEGEYALPEDADKALASINSSKKKIDDFNDGVIEIYQKAEASNNFDILDGYLQEAHKIEQNALLERNNAKKEAQRIIIMANQTLEDARVEEDRKKQLLDLLPGHNLVKDNTTANSDNKSALKPGEIRLERVIVPESLQEQPLGGSNSKNTGSNTQASSQEAVEEEKKPEVSGNLVIHRRH